LSINVVILAAASFICAMISGIIGMGGGILLLAVLFSVMPHGDAIPVHAAVQMVSNGSRLLGFLKSVDWKTYRRFCFGSIPGALVGVVLLSVLGSPDQHEPYLKMLVGAYVIVVSMLPAGRRTKRKSGMILDFPLIGFVAGTASLTIGAIGPLIAPVFARHSFVKERLIATKATCQFTLHALKIPAFWYLGRLDMPELGLTVVIMLVVAVPGTLAGKYVLKYVSDAHFTRIYRIVLLIVGLKVLGFDGFWALLGQN
jgi:uncharacterized protein